MVRWDESHLFREREVEKEDTTVRAVTSLIVNVAIRANAPPRMSAVYLLKLLIHMGRYEKWQLNRVCHKEAQKAQKILSVMPFGCYTQLGDGFMIYIQIPKDNDAVGFLTLAKSGTTVLCLPENTYGVSSEHLTLLRRKRIPFKKLEIGTVRIPKPMQDYLTLKF